MEMGRNHAGEFILLAGVLGTILPILMDALGYWGQTPAERRSATGYVNAMRSVAWTATPGAAILVMAVVQWVWWLAQSGH